jgi:Tfp pilus assembly protein PilN
VNTKTSTFSTAFPRVNLLPPEVHEHREFQRLTIALTALVALTFVGIGAFYIHGKSSVQSATGALAAAQARQDALQRDLNKLQYVVTSRQNVAVAEAALTQARSTDVHWADVLADLSSSLPTRAWYTTVNLLETVSAGTLPTASAAPAKMGSVTFAGYASVHNDTATWLDDMAKVPYFTNPYFTTSTEQQIGPTKVVSFASSVDVTSSAIQGCDTPGVC